MKAILEKINQSESSSFIYRNIELRAFDAPFHFHPEFELTHIERGEGNRYVGTQVEDFTHDDLIFLGSNLPHCWISKPSTDDVLVSATVIQFHAEFLGSGFFQSAEMITIKQFLNTTHTGIKILGNTKMEVLEIISQMKRQNNFNKLIGLIKILGILSESKELQKLDTSINISNNSGQETERFRRVFGYLIENYRDEISLQKISEIAHLSPTSFCRYFKQATGKTFLEIVNHYRIQYACRLLETKEYTVSQTAYESGFNDVPYFIKTFKKLKGMSPSKF